MRQRLTEPRITVRFPTKAFIDEGVSLSVIRTGAVPTVNDHILTLSTCTGNGHATRWVVQAVME